MPLMPFTSDDLAALEDLEQSLMDMINQVCLISNELAQALNTILVDVCRYEGIVEAALNGTPPPAGTPTFPEFMRALNENMSKEGLDIINSGQGCTRPDGTVGTGTTIISNFTTDDGKHHTLQKTWCAPLPKAN